MHKIRQQKGRQEENITQKRSVMEGVALQKHRIKGGHFLLGVKLSSFFPSQMGPSEEQIAKIKPLSQSGFISLSSVCMCESQTNTAAEHKRYGAGGITWGVCVFARERSKGEQVRLEIAKSANRNKYVTIATLS